MRTTPLRLAAWLVIIAALEPSSTYAEISTAELSRCQIGFEAAEARGGDNTTPEATDPLPTLDVVPECEQLFEQMVMHPFATLFSKPTNRLDYLDAQAVVGVSDYYASQSHVLRLDSDQVTAILAELTLQTITPSIWERLWIWLRELVGNETQGAPAWLENLIPSEAFLEGFLWVIGIVLVAAAIAVVIIEVRRGHRQKRNFQLAKQRVAQLLGTPPVSLTQVEKAQLQHQPSMLLAFILQELVEQKHLELPQPLTHRQVGKLDLSSLVDEGALDQGALQEICNAAENTMYGGLLPDSEEMQTLIERARILLLNLKIRLSEPDHG